MSSETVARDRTHAFGWPEGSVRALLALLVFGAIWLLLAFKPDKEVPAWLRDLLFIILGHYFASRGQKAQPGSAKTSPSNQSQGNPLYLPRGMVRWLLVLGFVGVGVWLYRDGRLADPIKNPAVVTLGLVAAFLLGVTLNKIYLWWRGDRNTPPPRWFEDSRAGLALISAAIMLLILSHQYADWLPVVDNRLWGMPLKFGNFGIESGAAAYVGFYFGTRS